jgi:hypothetical protein
VRVPSWYGLGVLVLLVARLIGGRLDKRDWTKAEASVREARTLLAERMADGDRRDERVAELTESTAAMTKRMEQYGRRSVKRATASLLVAVAALAVAVVVAVAA